MAASAESDEDETREAVFYRLEGMGYRVGLGVVERCVAVGILLLRHDDSLLDLSWAICHFTNEEHGARAHTQTHTHEH